MSIFCKWIVRAVSWWKCGLFLLQAGSLSKHSIYVDPWRWRSNNAGFYLERRGIRHLIERRSILKTSSEMKRNQRSLLVVDVVFYFAELTDVWCKLLHSISAAVIFHRWYFEATYLQMARMTRRLAGYDEVFESCNNIRLFWYNIIWIFPH